MGTLGLTEILFLAVLPLFGLLIAAFGLAIHGGVLPKGSRLWR